MATAGDEATIALAIFAGIGGAAAAGRVAWRLAESRARRKLLEDQTEKARVVNEERNVRMEAHMNNWRIHLWKGHGNGYSADDAER